MGKNKPSGNLGRSIIKDRFGKKHRRPDGQSHVHTTDLDDGYEWGRLNLQSVTERSALNDFLATAELAGTEFTAEKMNVSFANPVKYTAFLTKEEVSAIRHAQDEHKSFLKIPRRPHWDESTTPDQLDQLERESFLDWRKKLAELQDVDGLVLTPFEKNLQFWRQLWRVIERSDIVVQIVDGRNPLLFRCEDLETYTKEVSADKLNLLLINKADHLTEEQRCLWAEYFDSIGVRTVFWSAVAETERLNILSKEAEAEAEGNTSERERDDSDGEEEEEEDEEVAAVAASMETLDTAESDSRTEPCDTVTMTTTGDTVDSVTVEDDTETCQACGDPGKWTNSPSLVNGEELITLFHSLHRGKKVHEGVTTIGLVGYPNVGKSSTINAILQTKKVPVSATPGRTKHFQTLFVEKDLMLCDCPGLVMPSFVATKAEMVCCGILPIDEMRDCIPPIALVCENIGREILEACYGFLLPLPGDGEDPKRSPTPHELLGSYACMRGFMTHKGVPDYPRAARLILKDFVNGKLLFCYPVPGVSAALFKPTTTVEKTHRVPVNDASVGKCTATANKHSVYKNELDRRFFSKQSDTPRIGSRGVLGSIGVTNRDQLNSSGDRAEASMSEATQKSWKKHHNRNKKEKLRRLNSHLDA
ncbi:hypothetical protein NP493_441g01036 [Ridgeia piscesae]|uniref:Large subunit GTPase 1 homolog n=1 Tax=Ridgeia piscesae TaxID=27915 RepID=A0AAD9NRU6_RIDPI|nr:hypothetical protein NP493_441g01036 [Ridgeia piscesae]